MVGDGGGGGRITLATSSPSAAVRVLHPPVLPWLLCLDLSARVLQGSSRTRSHRRLDLGSRK